MADLVVRIVGDDSKLRSSLRSAEGSVSKFSGKVSGLGKSVAGGVFGGALLTGGLVALKGQLSDVFGEARESAKVGRLTDAVLKSTGGAANVSAGQIGKLADALSNKIGVDDEVIQSSENLLLTFTNVQNQVGKGNDIFSQATVAIQDMSAALGTDAKASTIQLGKALNDPIKGITALSRVGVSFTKQQKEQIKTLVESGDTLGAQKIILKELGKEFGGAAAAASDPMQKLSVTIANLKEKIGLQLLPVVEKVATWLGKNLPGILDRLGKIFKGVFDGAKKVLSDLAKAFGTNEGTILKVLGGIAAALVVLAVAWAAGPGIIITGVVALGAVLLYAYGHFEGFRNVVQATMRAVAVAVDATVTAVRTAIEGLQAFWETWGGRISSFTRGVFDGIKSYISGVLNVIKGLIKVVTAVIRGDWSSAWNGVKQVFRGVWEAIKGIVQIGITYLKSALSLAWLAIGNAIHVAWDAIVSFFAGIPVRVLTAIGDLTKTLLAAGSALIGGFATGISGAWDLVTGWLGNIGTKITGAVPDLGRTLWDVGWNLMSGLWDGIRAGWNWLADHTSFDLPKIHIPGTNRDIGGGHISLLPHLAEGGIVTSPTVALIGEKGPEAVVPLSRFSPAAGSNARPIQITMPLEIHTAANADEVLRILRTRGEAVIVAAIRKAERDTGRPVSATPR